MNIRIPAPAARIIRTLEDAGYEAYIVGGCVRDSLLKKEPKDWDITTSARPDEVKALFPRTIDTGIKHGTVTVRTGGTGYEVTTYRVDGDYADHRHPDAVTFTGRLSEDLERRDFTINAMSYNERAGLVDLFGGQEDLANRVIRAVGDPHRRFEEDALRMMRAVRFSAQLDFTVEEETRAGIRELAPTLSAVSAERIREELEKLLLSDHPEKLEELWELGLTGVFLPEFDAMMATEQHNPHHCYDVGRHTIAALRKAVEIGHRRDDPACFPGGGTPADGSAFSAENGTARAGETASRSEEERDRILRLALLLHDIAKPLMKTTDAQGIDHFKGHPKRGAELAGTILRRLKEDNRTIARVKNLITWHDLRPESDPVTVRQTAARVGQEDFSLLLDVMEADVSGQSTYLQQEKLTRLQEIRAEWQRIREAGEAVSLGDLAATGSDLIAAGMQPGPAIGEKLHEMLCEVLREPAHNTKEWLIRRFVGKRAAEELPGDET